MTRRKRHAVTDDISNDEVKPRAKPRPRKKQAVTKTNNAAIKALIHKNATTSPLLLLPSEVREKILIHLVGGNLIHIKYLEGLSLRHAYRHRDKGCRDKCCGGGAGEDDPSEDLLHDRDFESEIYFDSSCDDIRFVDEDPVLGHAICVANQTEQSAYEEAISGHTVVPEGESPEFYIASCKERHLSCGMCGSGPMFIREENRQSLRVDLNVLGVCRQLYEEANHLMWATNTFSFDDPKTFTKFFDSLNPAQKRNLTSLHISADIGRPNWSSHFYRPHLDDHFWVNAPKTSNLSMLRGVRNLHLCLSQRFGCVSPGAISSHWFEFIEEAQQADLESILRLRALSIKHVTVVISDDALELERSGKSIYRWTATKKKDYAEDIRAKIVDPSGADLLRKENEATNLARNRTILENAADRLESCKEILRGKQGYAVQLTRMASRAEARAESAADKRRKRPSDKALRKQEVSEKKKENSRKAADIAVEQEKCWQGRVADAREKYKRAMARLGLDPEDIEDEEEEERLKEGFNSSGLEAEKDDATQAHNDDLSEDDENGIFSPEEYFDGDDEGSFDEFAEFADDSA